MGYRELEVAHVLFQEGGVNAGLFCLLLRMLQHGLVIVQSKYLMPPASQHHSVCSRPTPASDIQAELYLLLQQSFHQGQSCFKWIVSFHAILMHGLRITQSEKAGRMQGQFSPKLKERVGATAMLSTSGLNELHLQSIFNLFTKSDGTGLQVSLLTYMCCLPPGQTSGN